MIQGALSESVKSGLQVVKTLALKMEDVHQSLFLLEELMIDLLRSNAADEDVKALGRAAAEEMKNFDSLYQGFMAMTVVMTDDVMVNEGKNFEGDKKIMESWINDGFSILNTVNAIATRMLGTGASTVAA